MTEMLRNRMMQVATAILLSAVPATGRAQVVYSNGTPDRYDGLYVDGHYTSANDFRLLQTTQLTSFDWYLLAAGADAPSSMTANYNWRILTDLDGRPGEVVASGAESEITGLRSAYGCCLPETPFSYWAYVFNSSITNLTLSSGTYWLAIGGFTSTYSNPHYMWASSDGFKGNEAKAWDDGEWATYPQEGAFSVYGTPGQDVNVVPEPASLLLAATGLGGLGAIRRRLKRTRN